MSQRFHRDDGAFAPYDANGLAYGNVLLAHCLPHVAVYLYIAAVTILDLFCHTSRPAKQRIGITCLVGVVLVQPAQGHRAYEDDA